MASHRLGRADVELVGSIAKHVLDGLGLRDVANVCAGAVNVDVVDILGLQTGVEGDNDEEIDYNLNFTFNKAQKREVRAAISNTFGFGGHNACVAFKKYAE